MPNYSKTSPDTLRLIVKASEIGIKRIDRYFSQGQVTSRQHLSQVRHHINESDSAIAGLKAQGEWKS